LQLESPTTTNDADIELHKTGNFNADGGEGQTRHATRHERNEHAARHLTRRQCGHTQQQSTHDESAVRHAATIWNATAVRHAATIWNAIASTTTNDARWHEPPVHA